MIQTTAHKKSVQLVGVISLAAFFCATSLSAGEKIIFSGRSASSTQIAASLAGKTQFDAPDFYQGKVSSPGGSDVLLAPLPRNSVARSAKKENSRDWIFKDPSEWAKSDSLKESLKKQQKEALGDADASKDAAQLFLERRREEDLNRGADTQDMDQNRDNELAMDSRDDSAKKDTTLPENREGGITDRNRLISNLGLSGTMRQSTMGDLSPKELETQSLARAAGLDRESFLQGQQDKIKELRTMLSVPDVNNAALNPTGIGGLREGPGGQAQFGGSAASASGPAYGVGRGQPGVGGIGAGRGSSFLDGASSPGGAAAGPQPRASRREAPKPIQKRFKPVSNEIPTRSGI